MIMHPVEVKETLASMVIYCDSREQNTKALQRRLNSMGRPVERIALSSGDYSCKVTLPSKKEVSFADKVIIERKMSVDEICGNFTRNRKRFVNEFERFKAKGGKPYLLIEDASWETIFSGAYRSKVSPQALFASLLAWQARYNAHVLFCDPESSGKLIASVLYYEVKEALERGDFDDI